MIVQISAKTLNQLRDLRHLTLPEHKVNGIGEEALTILAVIELAKRTHSNTVFDKMK